MCRNAGNGENGEYGKKLREGWRYQRVPFKSGDFGKKIFRKKVCSLQSHKMAKGLFESGDFYRNSKFG